MICRDAEWAKNCRCCLLIDSSIGFPKSCAAEKESWVRLRLVSQPCREEFHERTAVACQGKSAMVWDGMVCYALVYGMVVWWSTIR